MSTDVDVLIIGTGAGGGTAALSLAQAGKKVLMVERGKRFTDRRAFQDEKRMLVGMEPFDDRPLLRNGRERRLFNGGIAGGGSSLFGAVLLRPSPEDFFPGQFYHSYLPRHLHEWPIRYEDLAPWFDRAEELYRVSGRADQPPKHLGQRKSNYPGQLPALEPISEKLTHAMRKEGLNPFHLPLAIDFSTCLHCPTCPGYLCPTGARSSSLHQAIDPAIKDHGAELWTETEAVELVESKGRIRRVRLRNHRTGDEQEISAETVVLGSGALGTAALLLKSGVVNRSDQVGRNYMYHTGAVAAGVFLKPQGSADRFSKQVGFTDDYFGLPDYPHKLGYAQVLPVPGPLSLMQESPVLLPEQAARKVYERTVTLAGTVEDLPQEGNRVTLGRDGVVQLDHSFHRYDIERSHVFLGRLRRVMKRAGASYVVGMTGDKDDVHTAHQVGTARFGNDPDTAVLDRDCRVFGTDNLYVVDGSFMPTSLGVGPALTIIANAMRVADRIVKEAA
ncbi:GMC family oxidoreductase [bacterium]|nr:GMC family oxidoreductase [bacterium]